MVDFRGSVTIRTLHAQLLDELGRRIVVGDFPVGHKLPPEDVLARQLGVSKGALREAVKSLQSKGLLTMRPRLGTVVAARSRWSLFDLDVLRWHEAQPGAGLPRQLMQLRTIVEPEAARLACIYASEDSLEEIVAESTAMVDAFNRGERGRSALLAHDLRFHQIILESTGNEFIGHLARLLEDALQLSLTRTLHIPGSMAASLPLHTQVARNLRMRDADSAAANARLMLLNTLHELEV